MTVNIAKLLRRLLQRLPLRDEIIFESLPDFSCNAYPVYLRWKERFPEFRLVWAVDDPKSARKHRTEEVMPLNPKTLKERIRAASHLYRCRGIITTNRIVEKRRPDQIYLFLGHGSKTKTTKGFYEPGRYADYIQVQSHFFDEITMREYGFARDQLVYLGYPRCDWFFADAKDRRRPKAVGGEPYMIWLPTVRRRTNGKKDVEDSRYDQIGMPLVYSLDALKRLDQHLQQKHLHLLFKPHPRQDVRGMAAQSLRNIHVLTDQTLAEEDLQLYQAIAESSALITDYSSVFYDYLLLDRPIATTTDDAESWKETTGFAFDLETIYDRCTTRVSALEDLMAFADSVAAGKDALSAARRAVREKTNLYFDGHSADRVVDFMAEKLGLEQT